MIDFKRPKKEDYDFNDNIEGVRYAKDMNEYADKLEEQLRLYNVSNRYFVFSGKEDGKPTKYLVDDCKDRETAIAKIETEYPNFKWVMTETFNGC